MTASKPDNNSKQADSATNPGSHSDDSSDSSSVKGNFIRTLIADDLASAKHGGRIHTRFPPEPNGYLHIGHAKSICLNFSLAAENNGHCNLRFDDTNPEKESQEYVDSIKENISWLGFKWHGEIRYSSNYFEQLHAFAVQLITDGKAYVCDLSADEARQYRGSLTEAGSNSPRRDSSVDDNLALFKRMREGEFVDGKYSLRAKIDMAAPNMHLRDPILYRIRHIHHHQTGDQWCIYPTYDYTHCISDAMENITHSLCTLEFEDHRPLYDWILEAIGAPALLANSALLDDSNGVLPKQTEFAKLKINYTMMGKRKLREMVEAGVVNGWDDPRMPTLAGMRRRGFTPASIRNFCESVGVSRSDSVVDISMLEHSVRDDLDKTVPRAMCVLRPLKVTLSNIEAQQVEHLSMSRHPKDESLGKRTVPFTKELYIDRNDFEEIRPKGFKRLVLDGEVRLRGAYVIKCDEIIKDEQGNPIELICSVDKDTLGKKPEGRKVKGVLHWVSADLGLPVEVRQYDRLFNVENPEDKNIADYRDCLNPDSLQVLTGCIVEPSVLDDMMVENSNGLRYQFEREGYFCVDNVDSSLEKLVFNRTLSLRDSWSK